MIRPELIAWCRRNGEALVMLGIVLAGLWIATRGGPVLAAIGLSLAALGAVLLRSALLRLRFSRRRGDPGMVMVDERRVGYFGPDTGGFFEMGDIRAVDLMTYPTGAHWTLRGEGSALMIPTAARGAEQLFDLFASLHGFPMKRALDLVEGGGGATTHRLWTAEGVDPRPVRSLG